MLGQQEKDSSEERHCHGHHQIRPIWLPHWHCAQVLYITSYTRIWFKRILPTPTFDIQRWHQADHQKRGVKCEDGPWSGQFEKNYFDRIWEWLSLRQMFELWFHLQVSYYFQLAQQHQQQLQQNSGSPTQAQQVCFKVLLSWISEMFHFLFAQPQSQPQPQQQAQVVQSGASGFLILQTTWILKACLQ